MKLKYRMKTERRCGMEELKNSREGFSKLHEKIKIKEMNNPDRIEGVFMNPTGNYHMPVKYLLESNGYDVYAVDARKPPSLDEKRVDI